VKSSAIDTIIIVSADVRAKSIGAKVGAKFLRQEIDSGVNEAVKAADSFSIKNGADATIVIPHDLPLLRPQHINMIARSSEVYEKCIIICPSLRHDGTNILLRKPTDLIKTHFDNNSYVRHIQEAIRSKASIFVTISDNTMIDVDTKHDFEMLAKYESNTSTALEFVKRATTLWI